MRAAATLSPYRTMRYGAVTAFLASNSVHGGLLAHVMRVPMQSDNFFSIVRVSVRGRASLLFKNRRLVSLQSVFSNDQVENSAAFKAVRSRRNIGSEAILAVALCGM